MDCIGLSADALLLPIPTSLSPDEEAVARRLQTLVSGFLASYSQSFGALAAARRVNDIPATIGVYTHNMKEMDKADVALPSLRQRLGLRTRRPRSQREWYRDSLYARGGTAGGLAI